MNFSVPLLRTLAALAAVACLAPTARAQDPVQAELRALRELIAQQSKQLDLLTAQVARLSTKLDNRAEPGTPAAAAPAGAAPTVETTEFAVPATPQEPPRPANVHIVVKGESLERIAKTHGTSTAELQRLNRISDPKKLQIGQQLILPITPPPKEAP
jgi:LysM repeat protein